VSLILDRELRLSRTLTGEYATILDVARQESKCEGETALVRRDIAGEIAVRIQQTKRMFLHFARLADYRQTSPLPFLIDVVVIMILIELGKQAFIQQSMVKVISSSHQDYLDEVLFSREYD
jgi:hypothetical protein